MGELVTLDWANHCETLMHELWNQFQQQLNVDVKLTYQERLWKAHRLVLSIFCPTLKQQLETGSETITIEQDAASLHMDEIIEFIYRGKVTVKEDRLNGIRDLADRLGISALVRTIEDFQGNEQEKLAEEPGPKINAYRDAKKPKSSCSAIDDATEQNYEAACSNKSSSDESDDNQLKQEWNNTEKSTKGTHSEKPFKLTVKSSLYGVVREEDPTDTGSVKQKFFCKVCTKEFRHRTSVQRHVRSHIGPDLIFKCAHCSYETVDKFYWVEHLANVHQVDPNGNPRSQDIQCPECDFQCVTKQRLRAHVLRKHANGRPFKCNQCEHHSLTKNDLQKHIKSIHSDERPFICETCGFRSKTRSNFNSHLRSHTGLKAFRCASCDKAFTTKHKLKLHLLVHSSNDKPFVCHLCSHRCRRKDNLKTHLKRVHQTALDGTVIRDDTSKEIASHDAPQACIVDSVQTIETLQESVPDGEYRTWSYIEMENFNVEKCPEKKFDCTQTTQAPSMFVQLLDS